MNPVKLLICKILFPFIRQIIKAISIVEREDVLRGLKKRGEGIIVYGKITIENKKNVSIGNACTLNQGVYISGHGDVLIGDNVSISAGAMIITAFLDFNKLELKGSFDIHGHKKVIIGDYTQLGAGSIVLPGVIIGRSVIVGAGSVVTRNVPDNCIVAGIPAKVIRVREM